MLTQQQSNAINTAAHTHNYETLALADTAINTIGKYTQQFELDSKVLARSTANDIGGLIVYTNNKQLVAFYDYENFVGTVFN